MVREESILDLVEDIHTAALDGKRWPGVLTATANLIGGVDTTLEVHQAVGMPPLFFESGDRLPLSGVEDYLSHYAPICPRIPYLVSQETGSVGCDYDFISEPQMDRDAFYSDFLHPDNLRYFVSGTLFNGPAGVGGVYVHRSPRQGHADVSDLALMARLVPHFAQALTLHLRLDSNHSRETNLLSLLNHLPQAIVTLDKRGQVLFANDATTTIFRKCDGISYEEGKLCLTDTAASARMASILGEFFNQNSGTRLSTNSQVIARRPSDRPAYVLALHHLRGVRAVYEDCNVPSVVAFIYDPDRSARPSISALAQTFSLTRRETDLAFALLSGQTVQSQAAARGVKISTERSHLKSLMRKTDTHSQVELVRLLSEFLAAIP